MRTEQEIKDEIQRLTDILYDEGSDLDLQSHGEIDGRIYSLQWVIGTPQIETQRINTEWR